MCAATGGAAEWGRRVPSPRAAEAVPAARGAPARRCSTYTSTGGVSVVLTCVVNAQDGVHGVAPEDVHDVPRPELVARRARSTSAVEKCMRVVCEPTLAGGTPVVTKETCTSKPLALGV